MFQNELLQGFQPIFPLKLNRLIKLKQFALNSSRPSLLFSAVGSSEYRLEIVVTPRMEDTFCRRRLRIPEEDSFLFVTNLVLDPE